MDLATTILNSQEAVRSRRLDDWARVYNAPTEVPNKMAPTTYVCRGMTNKDDAVAYAVDLATKFSDHGCPTTVFVIRGPTSTTRKPFEVVTESAGYSILHRSRPVIKDSPLPTGSTRGIDVAGVVARFKFYAAHYEGALKELGYDADEVERSTKLLRHRLDTWGFRINGSAPINLLHGGRKLTRYAIKSAIERRPAQRDYVERLRLAYAEECRVLKGNSPSMTFFGFDSAKADLLRVDLKPFEQMFKLSPAPEAVDALTRQGAPAGANAEEGKLAKRKARP